MDDRKILELEPLPIARGYRRYRNAAEVRERHDAGYYLFEIYLKYVASIAIAHYLAGAERDHRVNAALKGLARPSLGEWLRFLRESLRFLHEREAVDPAVEAMASLFSSRVAAGGGVVVLYNRLCSFRTGAASERQRVSLETLLGEVVAYRNRVLGHGAHLEAEHYKGLAPLFASAFGEVVERSAFLTLRRLVLFDAIEIDEVPQLECDVLEFMGANPIRREKPLALPYGQDPPRKHCLYLLNDEELSEGRGLLLLDPLLVAHREDIYILNEARGAPEYLSYSTGERYQPADLGGAQGELFERILGYRVDETRLSRIGEDIADPVQAVAGESEKGVRRLGDYRIVREIGHGGMGTVFEAFQDSLGRRVALKVLPGSFALDPKRLERFRREARATARIHHPSIVPVYEVGESDGTHYYAMLTGQSPRRLSR